MSNNEKLKSRKQINKTKFHIDNKKNTDIKNLIQYLGKKLNSLSKKEIKLPRILEFRKKQYHDREILEEYAERRRNFWEIEIGKPVPQEILLQITQQLAAFTSAGIPIIEAINLLSTSTKNKRMKEVLNDMGRAVNGGLTLPQAVRLNSKVFPEYYVAILDASERSGDLTTAFETLASYLERDLASVRAVKSALYYPIILIAMSIATISILCAIVLPRFANLFSSLGLQLPIATRMLMSFAVAISTWWWLIILVLLVGVIIFIRAFRKDAGRLAIDTFFLKIPIFGEVIKLISLERFTRVLGSLADAGVPLPDSLWLSASAAGNKKFEKAIKETREGVLQGEGLANPLENSKSFPRETIQIIRVGEQSGQLVTQLNRAANYYSKEVDYRLKNITSLIEPIILLVVGGGVGFVAIALVSAMYGIYSGSAGLG